MENNALPIANDEAQQEGVVQVNQAAQLAPADAEHPINAQYAELVEILCIILKKNSNFAGKWQPK